jgi:uncharacterized protein
MSLWVDGHAVSLPGIIVLGLVVGYIAGLFGVGGGFLLTPLLTVVFRIPLPIAAGTGLCQMVGTALVALLRHRRLRQGEVRFDLVMLAGSLLGVDAGTRSLDALSSAGDVQIAQRLIPLANLVVGLAYIAVLTVAAVVFWTRREMSGPTQPGPLARIKLPPMIELPALGFRASGIVIAYFGFMLGMLSGLLGIGGGVAMMPVLIYGFGFPIRQAAGTGILVLLSTAIFGTWSHAQRGHVHLGLAMALLVGSTISAQVGALTTGRLTSRQLRRGFATVIGATILAVTWDLLRRIV